MEYPGVLIEKRIFNEGLEKRKILIPGLLLAG